LTGGASTDGYRIESLLPFSRMCHVGLNAKVRSEAEPWIGKTPFNGAGLRAHRLPRALTLRRLGALAGIAFDSIHAIETDRQAPRPSTVRKPTSVAGVAPDALFEPKPFEADSRRLREQAGGFSGGRLHPPESASGEAENG
jgi:hypothetical protein